MNKERQSHRQQTGANPSPQNRKTKDGAPHSDWKKKGSFTKRPTPPTEKNKQPSDQPGVISRASAQDVQVGDVLVVTIKRIGINGEGVGYYKRKAVFVPGALPEEVVKVKVTKVESSFIHASLQKLEKPSRDRIAPPCPVYEECGGCQLQHLSYAGQLRAKEELVREAFDRYVKLKELPLRPILGMDEPWGYRNKAQLQVGRMDGRVITGLYSAGSHRLVDITGCPIQHPVINRVMDQVRQLVEALKIPVYDEKKRSGALRTVVARIALRSGQIQLTFVTAVTAFPQREALVDHIRKTLPEVITIAQNVNPGKSSQIFGEETLILWGDPHLNEELGELNFMLSPRAFFQLNPSQTLKLYDAVKEAASLTGRERIVDAYCGTGTIGLWLAPQAAEVRGIELIEDAVADARRNAEQSGLRNARFYAGRAERLLPQWVREGFHPDAVVVDPPRTGCDAQLLGAILAAKPTRLVYVSCNPSTLAKDCRTLLEGGYRLEWVQPVDMFPQTAHVEAVCLLTKFNNTL